MTCTTLLAPPAPCPAASALDARAVRGLDEAALVRAAQAGDRRALDQLLRRVEPVITNVCRRIAGNEADAMDATQQALLAVVRGLPRFDGRSRLSTWTYRVATNACLDELRRRRRRPIVGLPELDGAVVEPTDPAREVGAAVADRLLVDDVLAALPEAYRSTVVLRELCNLEYPEIAEVLGVPVGTVRSRLARGRACVVDELARRADPALDLPLAG
ncbi:sigma-70 family RNA polymerase sigma factor [Aquihabitans sp. G128]|uniref:RNA polymerase sigma factor n=1 Tax=Aquihabitans sp. G128 TaxID=2849779 RepID=UPI001C22969B|nr:sigma-70 family RNA polymerase sigma factor [Aquihabitans sp. G128]QXC62148.1 sigma-70 family RNA polymerase sigma factor [Aquihabitans sp. G128]